VNRDFNDVNTVMKNGGAAIVSIAKASGEKRILKAMSEAVNSPLIANMDKQRTKKLLYIVYSGKKNPAKMAELLEINEFMENFDENIEVLWGHYQDDSLDDEIKVAIVATGFDQSETESTDEALSDVAKRQQQLRNKYYGEAHVSAPKEPEKPVEENEEEEVPEDEVPEEDVPPIVEDEVEEVPHQSSFWQQMVAKLSRFVEEERL
jgi:cell division protein FtsZ